MANAKKTVSPKPFTDAVKALISTVATSGFMVANNFAECVAAVEGIVKGTRTGSPRNRALEAAANGYKAGYVARSLLTDKAYEKRWGNLSMEQQIEEGLAILLRAAPTSKKDDRRTEQEHKACRAADVSWFKVKERAGLKEPKSNKGNRKPRPGSNKKENDAPKVDGETPNFTLAAPKLASNDAAGTYFANAIAALLATADVNADAVPKPWSDFINDTYQRAVKAKLIPSEK